ncbi:MAG: MATE family efflux transporter [Anaerolineae bacterium]|nr:MATE family efflux transporter [Anaerolineae bacterium]
MARSRHYQRDITQGSLASNIWGLTWPMTINQALFLLPGLYDAIWLGRLGPDAQAAAALTMSVRITMVSVLMALSLASGAVVARYAGAKDWDRANLAVLQAVILMVTAAGSLGLVGRAFARPLLTLAGADAVTLPLALRYARIIFAGLIAMEMVPSVGFMINAAGAPGVMLGMTLLSTGTLLVAEPLLVSWMGLEGAALALIGSNGLGMLWGLGMLVTGRAPVRLDLRKVRLDLPMMARILRIALPAVVQRGTPNLTMSLLTRLISSYGAPTLAAWMIVQRIFSFALIPSLGVSGATPAMVGQNLGAGQPERATRSVSLIARAALLVGGCILGLLALFAPQIIALFSRDAETMAIGAHAVRLLSIGQFCFVLSCVLDSAQAGAGDTLSPTVVNLIALWLTQVPLAYLFSRPAGLGVDGIWLALVLGWGVQAALMLLRFRQGRWKLKRI